MRCYRILSLTYLCVMAFTVLSSVCIFANTLPSQHGAKYVHLDCSSCLTVSTVLSKRMNTSLKESPPTVLLSQRLDQASKRQRHTYKTTELRAVEVLERMCSEIYFSLHKLRLNPKTKVRGYHRVHYEDLYDANQTEFLESHTFPNTFEFEMRHNLTLLPMAQMYTRKEREQLSAIYPKAPLVMCDILMAEFDDEMATIVKYANWKSEVDAKLCGFEVNSSFSDEYEELNNRLPQPISNICSDVDAIQKSAYLDQRRWYAVDQYKNNSKKTKQNVISNNNSEDNNSSAEIENDLETTN